MGWIAACDARAARWPLPIRVAYLAIKWFLVVMGAAGLTYNYLQKWGIATTIWLLLAPAAWGVYLGISEYRRRQP